MNEYVGYYFSFFNILLKQKQSMQSKSRFSTKANSLSLTKFFILWQEIEQANKAMDELRGSSLPSSDRGGMHIEYSPSSHFLLSSVQNNHIIN